MQQFCHHLLPVVNCTCWHALQGNLDAFLLALLVVFLPASTYIAIHAAVLAHWIHLWSVMLLVSVPLVYLAAIPDGLWWLPGPRTLVKGLQRFILMAAAMTLLAGECHSSFRRLCLLLTPAALATRYPLLPVVVPVSAFRLSVVIMAWR